MDLSKNINNVIIEKRQIEFKPKFKLSSDSLTAIYLTLKTRFLDNKQRYNLIISHTELLNSIKPNHILFDKITDIENNISSIENQNEKYFSDPTVDAMVNKPFTPSKTAQNGLTFVTKDEENNLCKKEQPEEILNVFRIIYVLVNHKYDDIPPQKLIDNMINVILPNLKIENLSKNLKNLYFRIFIFNSYC